MPSMYSKEFCEILAEHQDASKDWPNILPYSVVATPTFMHGSRYFHIKYGDLWLKSFTVSSDGAHVTWVYHANWVWGQYSARKFASRKEAYEVAVKLPNVNKEELCNYL